MILRRIIYLVEHLSIPKPHLVSLEFSYQFGWNAAVIRETIIPILIATCFQNIMNYTIYLFTDNFDCQWNILHNEHIQNENAEDVGLSHFAEDTLKMQKSIYINQQMNENSKNVIISCIHQRTTFSTPSGVVDD